MSNPLKLFLVLAAGLLLGAGITHFAGRQAAPQPSSAPTKALAGAPAQPRILYWYDPMVPDQHFDKPGKSPFMDMDLVPRYADAGEAGDVGIRIDPRTVQNLGVRTALAESGSLWRRVDTVGMVRADDNRIQVLQTRVGGWIEALHVHALNDPVRRGQLVAEVYSPELFAAQEEYLLARKPPGDPTWAAAARRKLAFLGLAEAEIAALEQRGQTRRTVSYHAPASGVVSSIVAHTGATVGAGAPLLEITDLSRVWVTAEVVEDQAGWIVPGKSAEVRLAAWPGEVFEARVDYVAPRLDPATRTVQARLVLDNPGLKLKPGMYASITLFGGKGGTGVLVPSEAVIHSGKRALVLLAEGQGRFRPVAVTPGMESEGKTLILAGLEAGARVVTSGQFLIESEARLQGALDRLAPPGEARP
jgi:Cu(I)/Ag(I) efflux system membrane fusion protein